MLHQAQAIPTNLNRSKSFKRRMGLLLLIATLVLIGWAGLLSRRPQVPTVIVLPMSEARAGHKPLLRDRWIPTSWSWLWRLQGRLLGPRKAIEIDT
jgi:hypothetical protein